MANNEYLNVLSEALNQIGSQLQISALGERVKGSNRLDKETKRQALEMIEERKQELVPTKD